MIAEYALETGTVEQNKPVVEPPGALPRDYRPAVIAVFGDLLALIAGGWLGHHLYAKHKQKRLAAEQSAAVGSAAPANTDVPLTNAAPPDQLRPVTAQLRPVPGNSQPAAASPGSAPAVPAVAVETGPAVLKLTVDAVKKTDVKISGDGKVLFKGRMHSDSPKTSRPRMDSKLRRGKPTASTSNSTVKKFCFPATNGRHGSISLDRKDLKAAAPVR